MQGGDSLSALGAARGRWACRALSLANDCSCAPDSQDRCKCHVDQPLLAATSQQDAVFAAFAVHSGVAGVLGVGVMAQGAVIARMCGLPAVVG